MGFLFIISYARLGFKISPKLKAAGSLMELGKYGTTFGSVILKPLFVFSVTAFNHALPCLQVSKYVNTNFAFV